MMGKGCLRCVHKLGLLKKICHHLGHIKIGKEGHIKIGKVGHIKIGKGH